MVCQQSLEVPGETTQLLGISLYSNKYVRGHFPYRHTVAV
jgi:hypothetical protein